MSIPIEPIRPRCLVFGCKGNKKDKDNQIFWQNIWRVRKKVLPLHSQNGESRFQNASQQQATRRKKGAPASKESWQSDRSRWTRNPVYPYGYRGFESLTLRKSRWEATQVASHLLLYLAIRRLAVLPMVSDASPSSFGGKIILVFTRGRNKLQTHSFCVVEHKGWTEIDVC